MNKYNQSMLSDQDLTYADDFAARSCGVSIHLCRRQFDECSFMVYSDFTDYVINHALQNNRSLQSFNHDDIAQILSAKQNVENLIRPKKKKMPTVLEKINQPAADQDCWLINLLEAMVIQLKHKLSAGIESIKGKTILHTAPHHDDILLGYHAYAVAHFADNSNYILYMTSGARGVADSYLLESIEKIKIYLNQYNDADLLLVSYQQSLNQFAKAYHAGRSEQIDQARTVIILAIIMEIFAASTLYRLHTGLDWLQDYLIYQSGHQPEHEVIKILKTRIRQSESDTKWSIVQGHAEKVIHAQALFYDYFSDAAFAKDVQMFLQHLHRIKPDVISVITDPFGVGPANHFTTLQVIAAALKKYGNTKIEIIGYRNVWGLYTFNRASMIVPVTEVEITAVQSIFTHCFASQQKSRVYDYSFSQLVTNTQQHQLIDLQTLLGHELAGYSGALLLERLTLDQLLEMV